MHASIFVLLCTCHMGTGQPMVTSDKMLDYYLFGHHAIGHISMCM